MAPGTVTGVYTQIKKVLLDAGLNFGTSTSIKVLLINGYTFADTHATMTAVKAASTGESTLGGYTTRGQVLTGNATSVQGTTGQFTATSPSWTLAAGTTPSHAILYNDTGTDGTSVPILAWELGVAPNGGTYTLTVSGTGILRIA